MDSSQWPSLGEWDPEFKQAWGAKPFPTGSYDDIWNVPKMRGPANAGQKAAVYARLDFTGVEQTTVDIPFRDGTSLPAVVYSPSTPSPRGSPLAVLFHGGGMVMGCAEMEALSAVPLVKEFNCIAISVEYRVAPEHPFPSGVNDSWDALKWCAANATKLGADPSLGFIIAGSSAGGYLTAIMQHLARDEKLKPPITGAALSYPGTAWHETIPEKWKSEYTAMEQNAHAPVVSRDGLEFAMKRCYKGDPTSDLFVPLTWSSGHAGLARTHVLVCGIDPLRDDGLLYERELRNQGVETKLSVYAGCPHGIDILYPHIAQGKKFDADRVEGFRWLLRQ